MKSHLIHEISKNRREWREEKKEEKKKRKKSRVRMMGRRAERRIERRDRGVWEQTAKGTEKGGHGKIGVG